MSEPDEPVHYKSDIRDDFDCLADFHGLERRDEGRGELLVGGDTLLVELYDCGLDFNTGRVVGMVRVETPGVQLTMLTRTIRTFGLGFALVGDHDGEEFQVFETGESDDP